MHKWIPISALGLLCAMHIGGARAAEEAKNDYRLSGPAVHANLAIYFIHGKSRGGPVPLTLQEAFAKKVVEVREIGKVNQLEVENLGDEEILIQSGDIVKGGKQDRVLSVSLVLPPHSGAVSIASYCVEQGRWSARGGESVNKFSSNDAVLPSREAKIEMVGTVATQADRAAASETSARQQEIWKNVAKIQGKLSSSLGTSVAAPRSQSSLQLALENKKLESEQTDYVKSLLPLGEAEDDIVGYVFAINGRVNSADVYPSNGLFRKMWPKLLRASVTEAIGDRSGTSEPPPPVAAVTTFLDDANRGAAVEKPVGDRGRVKVRESKKSLFFEARPASAPASSWMHRNYLAK